MVAAEEVVESNNSSCDSGNKTLCRSWPKSHTKQELRINCSSRYCCSSVCQRATASSIGSSSRKQAAQAAEAGAEAAPAPATAAGTSVVDAVAAVAAAAVVAAAAAAGPPQLLLGYNKKCALQVYNDCFSFLTDCKNATIQTTANVVIHVCGLPFLCPRKLILDSSHLELFKRIPLLAVTNSNSHLKPYIFALNQASKLH